MTKCDTSCTRPWCYGCEELEKEDEDEDEIIRTPNQST